MIRRALSLLLAIASARWGDIVVNHNPTPSTVALPRGAEVRSGATPLLFAQALVWRVE